MAVDDVVVAKKGMRPFHELLQEEFDRASPASKSARTRARVRIATAAELSKVSYHNLRLQDICAHAQIALGTFYLHFKTKQEVTADILSQYTRSLWHNAPRIAHVADHYQGLLMVNTYYVKSFEANSSLMRCLLQPDQDTPEFANIWQQSNRQWSDRAIKMMMQSRASGVVTKKDAHFLAHTLGCMVDALLLSAYVTKDPAVVRADYSPARIAEVVTLIWYKSVYVDTAGSSLGRPVSQSNAEPKKANVGRRLAR